MLLSASAALTAVARLANVTLEPLNVPLRPVWVPPTDSEPLATLSVTLTLSLLAALPSLTLSPVRPTDPFSLRLWAAGVEVVGVSDTGLTVIIARSEERRVGKECMSWGAAAQ